MAEHVSKYELLQRLHKGCEQFRHLIAPLTHAELGTPGVLGAWSIKDIVAHFIAHEQFALGELAAARNGEAFEYPVEGTDAINAAATAQHSGTPAEQVLLRWEQSFRQVVALAEALAEADFAPDSAVVQRLGDTIDGALANNTYEHYAEHTPAVREWIARR